MVLTLMILLSLTAHTPKWSKYSLKMTEHNSLQSNVKGLEAVTRRKSQASTRNLVSFLPLWNIERCNFLATKYTRHTETGSKSKSDNTNFSSLRNYSKLVCMHLELRT